jgi:energy-coupling factor transporter transmembrane protein EcfT
VSLLSPWGYLGFTIWGLVLALMLEGWGLAALVALELLFGIAWSQAGLRPLRRVRFWIFIATAVALGPLAPRGEGPMVEGATPMWAAPPGAGSLAIYTTGLRPGLAMAARAVALTLAFSLGLSALSVSDVIALFERLRLSGLGFALGVAMNLFNTLHDMARVTFETIKLRGGLRRPLLALRLFLVTLLSNTLRYGDQIVNAASVRAFDPNAELGARACSERQLLRADVGLLVGLAVCGVLLWVAAR